MKATNNARTFPVTRHYRDCDGTRNAMIQVRNDGSEEQGIFRIVVSHEC